MSGKARDLALALGIAIVSVLFTQDIVFAYPGFFLVLAIAALSSRRFRHLTAIAGMAALNLAVVFGMYVWMWSKLDRASEDKYWGKKYDVFYIPSKKQDRTDWTVRHYAALAAAPGERRRLWTSPSISEERLDELSSLDSIAWVFLHVTGVVVLLRARRYREMALLVSPGVFMTAFNIFGFWPLGDFRANHFALVYATAIAAVAFDRTPKRVRLGDFIPASVLVFAPLFLSERPWNTMKEARVFMAYFPQVMNKLQRLQGRDYSGPREKLLADSYSCPPLKYYMLYHPRYSQTIGPALGKTMRLVCSPGKPRAVLNDAAKAVRSAPRAWIVATKRDIVAFLDKPFPDSLEKKQTARIGRNYHLILAVEPKPEPPPPPENEPPPETEPEAAPSPYSTGP